MSDSPFSKAALEALVAKQLRESPPAVEQYMEEPYEPQGPPMPPRKHANWWMHAANLGSAGYDAYQTDKMRQWNENDAGKLWAGLAPTDTPGTYQWKLSTAPKLPIPMMGSDPSKARVYGQTLGLAALQSLASHFMPKKIGNIGLGINTASNLASGGIKQWGQGKVKSALDTVRDKYNMFDTGVKVPQK